MSEGGVAPDPVALMVQLIGGFQVSQAVYVAAELGVATLLDEEGPATVAELAARTGTQPEALGRLVRTLASLGVFTTDGDRVAVTPLGATLSASHPRSLHGLARMWMETHYLPFSRLRDSVRTGTPGAQQFFGEPFFDWVAADPTRASLFSRSMAELTGTVRAGMFDGYRLPPGRTVVDVGGSDGSILVELLARDDDPGRRGIVFDLPATVETAVPTIAAAGLGERVEPVAGDFFTAVPSGEVYVLASVLHDWDDDGCARLLASIARSAAPGARLIIVEGVVPPGDAPHLLKLIDLTMLGMLTGKERSEAEYRTLLEAAGFDLDRVLATSSPISVLEATLR